ncbi:hypothetical protein EPD60_01120 [Flaviaesturariibacter flavus]|uniref:Uncharacterized protein n=1 Tax=Flaviaesturariibacter flavus TaxID=2502780 RepID=A0A4R1BP14_9BACT|nr:hypothetical protein [Flaviaesturariibacter flavus]TCJ19047.1 hypothetical protein EPD60_01120 [Flaviaesturariibacter flavus]
MKNTFFRSTVAAALLAVGVVGCAPLQQGSGDYYDPAPSVSSAPTRIWVDDPYRPGSSILMERDPYSGRYFPVASPYSNYGRVYGSPYGSYDPYYGSGGSYGRPRGSRRGGSYRPAQPAPTQQQREQAREGEQRRRDAANEILGRKQ